MAYQRRVGRVWLALIQQGLKPTGGSIEEEGFDSVGHILFYHRGTRRRPNPIVVRMKMTGKDQTNGSPSNFIVPSVLLCVFCGKACYPVHLKKMDPIALTRRLIDIESISGNEGAVGAELYEVLLNMGYTTHKMPVAHERFNVVATIDGQKPELVFSTHMDTVPPFISSSEDHDNIYGRGSCDAKGIIAAQIAACHICARKAALSACCFLWVKSATAWARKWQMKTRWAAVS